MKWEKQEQELREWSNRVRDQQIRGALQSLKDMLDELATLKKEVAHIRWQLENNNENK